MEGSGGSSEKEKKFTSLRNGISEDDQAASDRAYGRVEDMDEQRRRPEMSEIGNKRISQAFSARESVEPRRSEAFSAMTVDTSDSLSNATPAHSTRGPDHQTLSRVPTERASTRSRSLPPLRRRETKLAQKEAHPWQHLGITLGLPMILLFDLIIPIIVFYSWYNSARSRWAQQCEREQPGRVCSIPPPQYDKDILGYAIICFGFGELWILIARVWRLVFRHEDCAPLLSCSKWELDATSWVYGTAMILALIPFVVGSSLELTHLYLYSPSFIMGFLGILMTITLIPFPLPVGINSQPRGTPLRPFIYYAAEDFIAVDGLQDREFRVRYNERYETNRRFRMFFFKLTLWWMLGVCVYIGSVSAVIWRVEFHIAFGLSFGILFSYIAIWAACTYVWVGYEMKREHEEYEAEAVVA